MQQKTHSDEKILQLLGVEGNSGNKLALMFHKLTFCGLAAL